MERSEEDVGAKGEEEVLRDQEDEPEEECDSEDWDAEEEADRQSGFIE